MLEVLNENLLAWEMITLSQSNISSRSPLLVQFLLTSGPRRRYPNSEWYCTSIVSLSSRPFQHKLTIADHEVYIFAKKLVQIFALSLGLEETALDNIFNAPLTDITMQHYPVQPGKTDPEELLYAHADYGGEYHVFLIYSNVPDILQPSPFFFKVSPSDHGLVPILIIL